MNVAFASNVYLKVAGVLYGICRKAAQNKPKAAQAFALGAGLQPALSPPLLSFNDVKF